MKKKTKLVFTVVNLSFEQMKQENNEVTTLLNDEGVDVVRSVSFSVMPPNYGPQYTVGVLFEKRLPEEKRAPKTNTSADDPAVSFAKRPKPKPLR